MPSVFTVIGQSWDFLRKQPVLWQCVFWLLYLPTLLMDLLSQYTYAAEKMPNANVGASMLLADVGILLLAIVTFWGSASTIVMGLRLLSAKSGRSRSSFSAVRSEARTFIIPILLTTILRTIAIFLWSLLLIIPGILYMLDTTLFTTVMVAEGRAYRTALNRSRMLIKGKKLAFYGKVIGLGLLLFVPAAIFAAFLNFPAPVGLYIIGEILGIAGYTLAGTLFTLSLIQLYGSLLPQTKPIMGGGKKKVVKKK